MAATGKTPILLYGSTTATNTPSAGNLTNSSDGCEIAINVADKNLFFKDATNTVNTVPVRQSSASSDGWLSSTDWSTFNSKQPAGSYALTTGTLAQFASTTSAQLAGVISDETGTGSLVFSAAPTLTGLVKIQRIQSTYDGSSGAPVWDLRNSNGAQWEWYSPTSDNSLKLDVWVPGQRDNVFSIQNVAGSHNITVSTGNLVIGTSGKGIDFSATASTGTSELLADYEEGTFNPTLTTDGTGFTSVTYSSDRGGRYIKVGNVVHFQLTIRTSSVTVGSATGNVLIGGLPFTAATSSGGQNGNAVSVGGVSVSWVTNNPVFGVVQNNSTNIQLYNSQAATTTVVANVGTGSGANYLQLTGTYISA